MSARNLFTDDTVGELCPVCSVPLRFCTGHTDTGAPIVLALDARATVVVQVDVYEQVDTGFGEPFPMHLYSPGAHVTPEEAQRVGLEPDGHRKPQVSPEDKQIRPGEDKTVAGIVISDQAVVATGRTGTA